MIEPPHISIVIPVYASEVILPELVRQVDFVMQENKWSYELIFVCDQSPDDSWRVICELREANPHVRGILLRVNAGQHNAIMAGLNVAQGGIMVTMDDDLQHSPSDIPRLVAAIEQGYDVAYARFASRKHPLWKILGSRINDVVARCLIKKPKDLYLSPFRAFNSEICEEIRRYTGPFVYVDGLILCVTKNIYSVDVAHHPRSAGNSRYGFRKSFSLWLKMATSFSIAPLRFSSVIGLAVALLGFLFALYLVIQRMTMNVMPTGWASLIVTVLIMGGAQLVALGLLGEYLGRLFLTVNARPQYVIAKRVGFQHGAEGPRRGNEVQCNHDEAVSGE